MTCYYCGDQTEQIIETDRPLTQSVILHYQQIGVCEKERCQKKLEKRLRGIKSAKEMARI